MCEYRSGSNDPIYNYQQRKTWFTSTQGIHKVDRNSYLFFLRYINWKTAPILEDCMPTLDKKGRCTMTFQHLSEVVIARKPVKEKLGKPTHISCIQTSEPPTELQKSGSQTDWHDKEDAKYRKVAACEKKHHQGH